MTSPTNKSQLDNEIYSHEFFDEPNNQIRKFVKIVQKEGETVDVNQKPRGVVEIIYNEVASVPFGIETKINEYVVPAGKNFDSCCVTCSGDNISRFIVKIDGVNLKSQRTWYGNFNTEIQLPRFEFNAGAKLQVFVINRSDSVSDYETSISGNVYDAN